LKNFEAAIGACSNADEFTGSSGVGHNFVADAACARFFMSGCLKSGKDCQTRPASRMLGITSFWRPDPDAEEKKTTGSETGLAKEFIALVTKIELFEKWH